MSLTRAILQFLAGILLVFGAGYGLKRWASSHPVKLPAGFAIPWREVEVAAVLEDGDHLWAGGKDGLGCFDRKSGQRLPLPGNPGLLTYIKALAKDGQGRIWVAHAGGFERWDGTAWQHFGNGPGLSLLASHAGFWLGTEKELFQFAHEELQPLTVPKELKIPSFDVLFEAPNGALWIGSMAISGGLWKLDKGAWTAFGCAEGLPHSSVNALCIGPDGAFWAGTGFADLGGAARFEGGKWIPLLKRDGLAGNKVRSLFTDRGGTMYFGSEYDGLAVRKTGQWSYLNRSDGLAGKEIKAMLQDADGIYWLGTDTGLSRIEGLSDKGRIVTP
jgi:ligand-binding sensor domain-containing protein